MLYSFTVTEVTYNFTATMTIPLELALDTTSNTVNVTDTTAVVSVINSRPAVSVVGGSIYNQGLNTGDNVSFASVTTPTIYGTGGAPVVFPNGFSAPNAGTIFINSIDFGLIV